MPLRKIKALFPNVLIWLKQIFLVEETTTVNCRHNDQEQKRNKSWAPTHKLVVVKLFLQHSSCLHSSFVEKCWTHFLCCRGWWLPGPGAPKCVFCHGVGWWRHWHFQPPHLHIYTQPRF